LQDLRKIRIIWAHPCVVVSTSSTTTPGRALRNSLTVSRFLRHSLRSFLSPVALRSLRLLGCSMPLRKKSVKIRSNYPQKMKNLNFCRKESSSFSTVFPQNNEISDFCRKNNQFFPKFVSNSIKNRLFKKKNTYKNRIFHDFVGKFMISNLKLSHKNSIFLIFVGKI